MSKIQYGSRIEKFLCEMRGCVIRAENAWNEYYQIRDALIASGKYTRSSVDILLGDLSTKVGQMASAAVADNRTYSNLVIMYGTAAQTEMMAEQYGYRFEKPRGGEK